MSIGRTVYVTLGGYCTNRGNPVGETLHGVGEGMAPCDMEGAEVRGALLDMAFEEFCKVERAIRLVEKVRQYLDWADDESCKELREAIRWFEKGASNG